MYIIGISAYYHDSAAVLIKDEVIVAAAQEERFSRKKHDARFPGLAIKYCLEEAGITMEQVDHVGFFDKPFLLILNVYISSYFDNRLKLHLFFDYINLYF